MRLWMANSTPAMCARLRRMSPAVGVARRRSNRSAGGARLKEQAPAQLRSRIAAMLPARASPFPVATKDGSLARWWRTFLGGFSIGTALSAALAATVLIGVFRGDQNRQVADEVVSAHIRSLQAGHLTDVQTSDQHTVKPWFNGKLDVAPPVIDLTAQGFTLLGGRLDYIDREPVASIIYARRKHVINLFVAQHLGARHAGAVGESIQGYNVRHWAEEGLDFWAVSDLNGDELDEFVQKVSAALHTANPT